MIVRLGTSDDPIFVHNFLKFSCMIIHRIQTLTHWLAHRSSYKNLMSALSKLGGGYHEIKQGQNDYSGKKYARKVSARQVISH